MIVASWINNKKAIDKIITAGYRIPLFDLEYLDVQYRIIQSLERILKINYIDELIQIPFKEIVSALNNNRMPRSSSVLIRNLMNDPQTFDKLKEYHNIPEELVISPNGQYYVF